LSGWSQAKGNTSCAVPAFSRQGSSTYGIVKDHAKIALYAQSFGVVVVASTDPMLAPRVTANTHYDSAAKPPKAEKSEAEKSEPAGTHFSAPDVSALDCGWGAIAYRFLFSVPRSLLEGE
jgi:hypothetical protein